MAETTVCFNNHSCEPNCRLKEIGIGSYTFVFIQAVKYILLGTELTMDYGSSSVG